MWKWREEEEKEEGHEKRKNSRRSSRCLTGSSFLRERERETYKGRISAKEVVKVVCDHLEIGCILILMEFIQVIQDLR